MVLVGDTFSCLVTVGIRTGEVNVVACGGGTIGALVVVAVRFGPSVALNGSTCRMPTGLSTAPRYLTTSCARLAISSLLIDGSVLFCAGSETHPSIIWRSRLHVTSPRCIPTCCPRLRTVGMESSARRFSGVLSPPFRRRLTWSAGVSGAPSSSTAHLTRINLSSWKLL